MSCKKIKLYRNSLSQVSIRVNIFEQDILEQEYCLFPVIFFVNSIYLGGVGEIWISYALCFLFSELTVEIFPCAAVR